jgi:hypothetical protein
MAWIHASVSILRQWTLYGTLLFLKVTSFKKCTSVYEKKKLLRLSDDRMIEKHRLTH